MHTVSGLQVSPPVLRPDSPSLKAFLELGFRPLYLGGTAWAVVAIAIWIFAPTIPAGPLQGILWHAHEMIWGFLATIAVAFLLTASANWTGIVPLRGAALGALSLVWLVARLAFLLPGTAAFSVAAVAEVAFFLAAAVAVGRVILLARSRRNYGVPGLLAALAVVDALFLSGVRGGDYLALMTRLHAGLLVMGVVALLIAGRVIPFFASRAVPGLVLPAQARIGQVRLVACCAAVVLLLAGLEKATAVALATAGVLALFQLARWKPLAVRHNPLLWILYAGYAGLGLGLVMAACARSGIHPVPPALPVHVLAMGGFSVLVIGMVTRTALGHLGRPLKVDRSMVAAYALVLVATVLRLVAIWPSQATAAALRLSAAAWIAAFVLYLWRFFPMLIRPRA